ncbi:uroporphyrinogen-III C-methyltransferase [Lysinimonas soli]|uniref:uroporphyrinogen-III C-methyltransferase n=1 Tax=Lysinimonas soli TaxID=1074233 RepID=A0ABW0NUS4_9MICO
MEIDLDLAGRRVLVVGGAPASRLAIARVLHAGASVFLASVSHPAGPAHPVPAAVHRIALPRTRTAWRELLSAVDLVVIIELPRAAETTLRAAARDRRVWIVRESPAATSPIGHVTLAGGGPGDEGMLTLAAREALRRADVVFFDRLAPQARGRDWAPGAEWVDVGKTPGHHAVPQAEIERQMVDAALAGRTVVRLKGGDPFVFGRGGEEVAACRAAGVPVTVLSGVTSAIAVPAAAGIPVTHREVSRMFTVVSGHAPLDDATVAHLIGLDGTIVVLMGVNTLPHLAAALTRNGMPSDMPLAVIERGLTPGQRTTITTVGESTEMAARLGVRSPAILVIGEVVRLCHDDDAALREVAAFAAGR